MMELTKQVSEYYGCSWGEVIAPALPRHLKTQRIEEIPISQSEKKDLGLKHLLMPSSWDEQSFEAIFKKIEFILSKGKQVLCIVPDAFLMFSVLEKLKEKFPNASILENLSKTTVKEEWNIWRTIKEQKVQIVIGMRSSIFLPFSDLGLVVVFDEDNELYKQEQTPYYHLRNVALMRAEIESFPVIFTTLAPTLELYHLSKKKKL